MTIKPRTPRTEQTTVPGDVLAILLERFVLQLLDQAQVDGLRGNLSGATVRRLVARDLSGTLQQWREDHGKILETIDAGSLP